MVNKFRPTRLYSDDGKSYYILKNKTKIKVRLTPKLHKKYKTRKTKSRFSKNNIKGAFSRLIKKKLGSKFGRVRRVEQKVGVKYDQLLSEKNKLENDFKEFKLKYEREKNDIDSKLKKTKEKVSLLKIKHQDELLQIKNEKSPSLQLELKNQDEKLKKQIRDSEDYIKELINKREKLINELRDKQQEKDAFEYEIKKQAEQLDLIEREYQEEFNNLAEEHRAETFNKSLREADLELTRFDDILSNELKRLGMENKIKTDVSDLTEEERHNEIPEDAEHQEGKGTKKYNSDSEDENSDSSSSSEENGLSISDINNIMEEFPYFYGCVTNKKELDKVIENIKEDFEESMVHSFIYRIEDKDHIEGHWVSIFINIPEMYIGYYDSLGGDIPSDLKNKIQEMFEDLELPFMMKLKTNNIQIEPNTSSLCGMYVMYELCQLYFGQSWKDATNYTGHDLDEKLHKSAEYFGFI